MGKGTIQRALLGALLVLGLVAMHELAVPGPPSSTHAVASEAPGPHLISAASGSPQATVTSKAPIPAQDTGHGFGHLCVFVLTTLLCALLLRPALWTLARSGLPRGTRLPPGGGRPLRRPPATGRELLHLVCCSRT